MKILRVIASMDPRTGGPSEGLRQISRALDAEGHRTEVACLDAPDDPWLRESPWPVHALGPVVGSYRYSGRLLPWLRSHIARFDCAIVHGVWQFSSLGVWLALRRSNRPYFLYSHGMLDPWFRRAYPLKHLKKALYWRLAEHRVLRDARAVLFTSEEERLLARRSFHPFECNEVVVNYGILGPDGDLEVQRQAFLDRFPELSCKRILLSMGRIHLKKGCDLLVEAFATVARSDPSLHLVMAGPDETGWQDELRRRSEELGVGERITWAGMLSGDLKWGAFRASDAFILPSHSENFGIVVAEALACGLPTLISDKVNIWREVQADGAGFVAPDDLEGTAAILGRWLDGTERERDAMRCNALRCFENRFHVRARREQLDRKLSAGMESRIPMNPKLKRALRVIMPRKQKPHVILGGPLKGARIVTSWHDYPAAIFGYAEPRLTSWLLENVGPGETWLDVGAHYGYTSIAMCKCVGGDGRVFAFEPSLETVACLERTRRENGFGQWSLLPFALGDESRMTLRQCAMTRGMIDSQIPPEQSEGTSQMIAVGLDAIWDGPEPMAGPVHGVKMDVQGMELEALRGMAKTLSLYRPKLVVEVHPGVSREAILSTLVECGYQSVPVPIEGGLTDFSDPECNYSFAFSPSA